MKTRSGTNDNLIQRYRLQAQREGKSMEVKQIWDNGRPTGRMAIYVDGKFVTEGRNLAALYGRT
jgi:hypothetical protein